MNAAALDEAIIHLSGSEKLALIEKLWNSIDADDLTVPPEVATELDRRWAEHLRDPSTALTLDQLLTRVEERRRKCAS
jgi:putative addiction module component (TIGR02574 family)